MACYAEPVVVNHGVLYGANGCESWCVMHSQWLLISKTRREVRKLVLFYKIVIGQEPDYLTELVPPTVADTNNYNLRNSLHISQPSYRLSTY